MKMKKKLLAFVCMITCIFTLAACGKEPIYTEFEQQKLNLAEETATSYVEFFANNLCQGVPFDNIGLPMGELTMEEVSEVIYQTTNGTYNADGAAIVTGVESFRTALETMGGMVGVNGAKASIDGNQIVVNVDVEGFEKNATAEIVFSNDIFLRLESASLNPTASFGELMKKAGLNTLIGMTTVFAVLILISAIISAFAVIPKIQAASARRKAEKQAAQKTDTAPETVSSQEYADETDDLELIAVIAAAIAASEGAQSTDGFVVRSIRRRV